MHPLEEFDDFSHFCLWYQDLVPQEPLNLEEAAAIYFNYLELYENFI